MLQQLKKIFKHYIVILLLLTLISSFFTYTYLAKIQLSEIQDPKYIIILIIIDLVLFLCLSTLLARKLFRFWHKSKHQSGRLQNKIIFTFCLVTAIPTIIITVFSTIFFNFGIQSWFDERVSTAINESVEVAESYFRAQLKLIESDVIIMSQDINYLGPDVSYGPERLVHYLNKQSDDKDLVEAVIFQTSPQKIIAESKFNFSTPFNNLPKNALEEAKNNIIVVMNTDDNQDKVRALVKLSFLPNCYLLVARTVDVKVLNHMVNTKGAASEYERLRGRISSLEVQFLVVFLFISCLLLLTAIWLGVMLSSALINPLNKLVNATKQISEGDFDINIIVKKNNDEISVLGQAFNAMAVELSEQRRNLMIANNEIEVKRHFSETILSGVSAGIIAIDSDRSISMLNKAALNILSIEYSSDMVGSDLNELCPEVCSLLPEVQDYIGHEFRKEIAINSNGNNLILVVRIIAEKLLGKTEGYIITFDNITALVLAQRSAAWSDVARKVAHEIKNPLTPIHLAAERLKRKYLHEVSDSKNFERYVEIIEKHVKDIGTIVEEFVQFARMPSPTFDAVNLAQLVKDAIFSRKCLEKNIDYQTEFNVDKAIIHCDLRQISQVLLNLFKNAEEAIEQNSSNEKGEIRVKISLIDSRLVLSINDNGGGFPVELFDHITEPYITSKSTGTGLGLAIVKKILDDHKIEISFSNNQHNGAIVKLIFNMVE
jgi:two-component system, NtrC family, nitrogen regulation sensor histidine kinase NtrY